MRTELVFGVAPTLRAISHHTKFSAENINDCKHQNINHLQSKPLINTDLEQVNPAKVYMAIL